MTHEEETINFLGDDYCQLCLCSWYDFDDECTCECHELPDWADREE